MPSLAPRIDTLESTPTFSGAASFAAGSAAAPSLRFTVDPTTGLYRIGAGNIGFTCAGVNAGGVVSATWTLGSIDPLVHVAKRHDLWGRELRLNTTADQNAQLSLNVMASAASFNKTGYIVSSLLTAQDSASGSGLTTAAMTIMARKADDYIGTNGAALVNRPLFYFQNNTSNVAECLASGSWIFGLVAATAPEHRFNLGNSGTGKMRFNLNNTLDAYIGLNGTASGILDYNLNHTFGGITGTNSANAGGTFRIDSRDTGGSNLFSFHARGLGDALNVDNAVMSITAAGACTIGASGASGTKVSVNSSSGAMPSICNSRTMSVYNDTDAFGIQAVNGFASYTGVMISAYSVRASSNLFSFISCVTGDGASGYNVANAFVVAGDGTVRAGDSGSFAITPIGEHRFYSPIAQTSFGSVDVFDTRTQTTGVGGMISFSGFKIAQTNGAIYAGIKGSKVNSTSNNEQGQLKFYSCDGSSLKEGGYLDPFSGWVFGLALGNTAPSLPFKPLIIQTPTTTTVIGYTKFFKFGASTTVIDLVTISSASWDVGHNIDVEVQVTNISPNNYSLARGHARGIGSTSANSITTAMVATDANGVLGLGTLAWTAGTGAATLQYTPPANTDYSNYEITITNRKFPFTLP